MKKILMGSLVAASILTSNAFALGSGEVFPENYGYLQMHGQLQSKSAEVGGQIGATTATGDSSMTDVNGLELSLTVPINEFTDKQGQLYVKLTGAANQGSSDITYNPGTQENIDIKDQTMLLGLGMTLNFDKNFFFQAEAGIGHMTTDFDSTSIDMEGDSLIMSTGLGLYFKPNGYDFILGVTGEVLRSTGGDLKVTSGGATATTDFEYRKETITLPLSVKLTEQVILNTGFSYSTTTMGANEMVDIKEQKVFAGVTYTF